MFRLNCQILAASKMAEAAIKMLPIFAFHPKKKKKVVLIFKALSWVID
jgi:hypothetical protein